MLTDIDGIPVHLAKVQRFETLIFFVAVFQMSGPKWVSQNHQLIVGRLRVYVAVTFLEPFPGITNPFAIGKKVTSGERPPIPTYVGSNWRELICACWNQTPQARPTFDQIVMGMGSADFLDASIDRQAVLAYQQKTLPAEFHYKGPIRTPAPVAKPKTALEQLKDAADAGDGAAANAYAKKLKNGDGVPQNLQLAAQYFRRAAKAGDVDGMIQWGRACEMAHGVQQNYTEAARWYKAAMDRGNAHAAWCYADMLENGKGTPKDPAGAVRCYKYAADAGHEKAQARYGLILENGMLGVPKNLPEAVRYYKMSSDQGNAQGMFFYADMLEFGKGLTKNMNEAVRLYRLAAEKGHLAAIGYLGFLLFQGNGVRKDAENGLKLMAAAADQGDTASWLRLGAIFEATNNRTEAFKCYQKAAEKENIRGVLNLARCFEEGIGCTRNPGTAADLYQKLINQANDADSMFRLGQMKVSGKGVPQDVVGGIKLLQKASSMGNEEATKALRQLFK
jgi:TPR repeat protein